MKKELFIIVSGLLGLFCLVCVLEMCGYGNQKGSSQRTQERGAIQEVKQQSIQEKLELVYCKAFESQGNATFMGGYYYHPKLVLEWKNNSGRPINESIFVGVTIISDEKGKEMLNTTRVLHSRSDPPFLPGAIKEMDFRSSEPLIYQGIKDLTFYIYVNDKLYKKVKFENN